MMSLSSVFVELKSS